MFIYLLILIAILVYILNNYLFSYWTKRGFKQLNPKFFVGDASRVITGKTSLGQFLSDSYFKFKHLKICGLYMFYQPILLVNDTKLVQDILIHDFNSFQDRPMMPVDERKDPLSAHMFSIQGQRWKDLRFKISPTFTSSKLKEMFPIIRSVGQVLENYLEKNINENKIVFEFRDLMERFNLNIISSVAFGIDHDCINEPDHIFRKMGAKMFETSFGNSLRSIVAFIVPSHFHKLGLRFTYREVEEFIRNVVNETVEYREKNNYSRNDFMQMLIQLKNQGYVSVDKNEKIDEVAKDIGIKDLKKLSMDELTANVLLFLLSGFETSSSTLSFCLFELARRPDIQKKIQDEIDQVLSETDDGEFTYDNLAKLKYLECCIDETLRKYPIVPIHFRKATNDYEIKGTGLIIPKGTGVYIPVLGIQRDPEIYDNPMEFIPERFMNSSTGGGKVEGVCYMPFGVGPRNCIGMRLGKLTTKVGLALVLQKFTVAHTNKEFLSDELDFHPTAHVLTPTKPFNLEITQR